jgi:hypothetical protein
VNLVTASGPQLALLLALTTGVGVLMTRIGVATRQLRQRATRRHCPCCGRRLSPRGCNHCGF